MEEIRKSISIDGSTEAVFRALTDEKELILWMPQEAKFDPKVGGEYEFKFRWAARNLETVLKGKVLELVPAEKLSYTWDSETTSGSPRITHSVVTWILEEQPGGKTKATLVQSNVQSEFLKDADAGWNHYLSQLEKHFKNC